MKLLVVEDDELLQQGLALALTGEGYVCDCAATAAEASGGVRSYADALAMLDAGATRLGTSGSAVILGEARRVDAGEQVTGAVDASSY